MTWKKLIESHCPEWKLTAVEGTFEAQVRDTAICASSMLPVGGQGTGVDNAPAC